MKIPYVFNIQKFSVHDGPGIRTTIFFKGCPLKCQWCHNPESQRFTPEIMLYHERCNACGACIKKCPTGANSIVDGKLVFDTKKMYRLRNLYRLVCKRGQRISRKTVHH